MTTIISKYIALSIKNQSTLNNADIHYVACLRFGVLTILISTTILSGCSWGLGDGNNDFFLKKQECAKYLDSSEQYVQEWQGSKASQVEVYYSPKLDTCIRTFTTTDSSGFRAYFIQDILTNEPIYQEAYLKDQVDLMYLEGISPYDLYKEKKEALIAS